MIVLLSGLLTALRSAAFYAGSKVWLQFVVRSSTLIELLSMLIICGMVLCSWCWSSYLHAWNSISGRLGGHEIIALSYSLGINSCSLLGLTMESPCTVT